MENPQEEDECGEDSLSISTEKDPLITTRADAELADQEDHQGDAEVWQSFEQSVAYMANLSALYNDAFLSQTPKRATTVTAAHIEAAKGHAREAVELLASNLLNASTAIVASMEIHDEQLQATTLKLQRVEKCLQERQRARDQQVIKRFYESSASPASEPPVDAPTHSQPPSLKLALNSSPTTPSYLYL